MTAPSPEAAASTASGPTEFPAAANMAGDPALTPPVTAGPVAASSLGGIPFIALNEPVHHYSGKRLREFIMTALTEAGLTIEIPE